MISKKYLQWLVIIFFIGLIAIVFQQVYTDMADQGIASGGPYDNAAAYPQAIAILLMVLLSIVFISDWTDKKSIENSSEDKLEIRTLKKPTVLLLIFGCYLFGLGVLGYHIITPIMIMCVLYLCNIRRFYEILIFGVFVSLLISFFFEVFLKIVLPGGIFGLNIPW